MTAQAQLARLPSNPPDTKDSEISEITWEEFLGDRDRIEWLLHSSRQYANWFEADIDYCHHLMRYDNICYILDFDVLRHHLDGGSVGKVDTFAVDYLLYSSSQPYALPAGAYAEFFYWLRKDIGISQKIFLDENITSELLIYKCATLLGIENAESMNTEEALDEISERLDHKSMVITRLLRILTDPRFKGVVSAHDSHDAEIVKNILADTFRNESLGNRKDLDSHDALNIAIAIKGAREAIKLKREDPTSEVTGYVLVSQTKAVLDCSKQLEGDRYGEPDFVRELSNWLGFGPAGSKGFLPVMSPRHAVNIELLGVYENPQKAITRIKNLRGNFNDVISYLMTSLTARSFASHKDIRNSKVEDLYERVLSPYLEDAKEIAQEALKSIASKMLVNDSDLRRIEEGRSLSISVAYSRGEKGDAVRHKSVGFLKLLGELLSLLGEMGGVEYGCKTIESSFERPFEEFKIFQSLPQSYGDDELVAAGEIYGGSGELGNNVKPYYVIRWPIFCLEDSFIEALRKIIVSALPPSVQAGLESDILLTPVMENSAYWDEGVIIHTSEGVFGALLAPFLYNDMGWYQLRYRQLSSKFNSIRIVGGYSTSEGQAAQSYTLLQYRVNTRYGDFVFDIEPAEDEMNRYMTIISSYNLSSHIAELYSKTSNLFILPSKLEKVLTEKLSLFAELPDFT